MVEEISITKLMELYLDTIQNCGTYLLSVEDEVIEYNIFEEFDIGVVSFLHRDNLLKLRNSGLISDEVMEKSSELRNLVIGLQETNKWNVEEVRNSSDWRYILELTDEIKTMIE